MLNFKLNEIAYQKEYKQIKLSEIYFSPDGSFITGVTSYSNGLVDGQKIYIEKDNSGYLSEYVVEVKNVERQGIMRTYKINDGVYDYVRTYELTERHLGNNIYSKGVLYKDGLFYLVAESGDIDRHRTENEFGLIEDGETYDYIKSNDYIILNKEYYIIDDNELVNEKSYEYVEDGNIKINGIDYEIDVSETGLTTVIELDNMFEDAKEYQVEVFPFSARTMVSKVTIRKKRDIRLYMDMVYFRKEFFFITVLEKRVIKETTNGTKDYGVEERRVYLDTDLNKLATATNYEIIEKYLSDNALDTMENENFVFLMDAENKIIGSGFTDNTSCPFFTYKNKNYPIESEIRNSLEQSEEINLYVGNDNEWSFSSNEIIRIEPMKQSTGPKPIRTSYFYYEDYEDIDPNFNIDVYTKVKYRKKVPTDNNSNNLDELDYVYANGKKYYLSSKQTDFVDFVCFETFLYGTKKAREEYEIIYVMDGEKENSYYGYFQIDESYTKVYVETNYKKLKLPDILSDSIKEDDGDEEVGIKLEIMSNEYEAFNPMYGDSVQISLIRKRYVEIDDERYFTSYGIDPFITDVLLNGSDTAPKLDNDDDSFTPFIDVDAVDYYDFKINTVNGSNFLVCSPCETDVWQDLFDLTDYKNYRFFLKRNLYKEEETIVKPIDIGSNIINRFRFYIDSTYLNLPIALDNTAANNMLQDVIVKRDFIDKNVESSINRIIDMEKDMYYPAFKINEMTSLIDELEFKLHFRTRDLTSWTVNEDYHMYYSNSGLTSNNMLCNWNVIDYYYDDNYDDGIHNKFGIEISPNLTGVSKNYYFKEVDKGGNSEEANKKEGSIVYGEQTDVNHSDNCLDNTYYREVITKFSQPADLLYFLKFDDDDVQFQKSKLKKSFLRLLFYDTPNPETQSLLAMSTIFFDVNKFYKIFLDNSTPNEKDTYGFVDITNGTFGEYCGVNKEPFNMDGDGVYLYDESKRLSATFKVKSILEETESSEGFYLFLFKEFSSSLHERDIYLKIQFNNASTGKVVNFLIPTGDEDENGNYTMLDMTDVNDRERFKEGYSLHELYERSYIKLRIKFDFEKKKYVYFLPDFMYDIKNPSKAIFNLYEYKIKDESSVYVKDDTL